MKVSEAESYMTPWGYAILQDGIWGDGLRALTWGKDYPIGLFASCLGCGRNALCPGQCRRCGTYNGVGA